jgi:hypothetical protein
MLATFFVHDMGQTQKWRLKGHAVDDFWEWVCSWAVMLRMPSDLGYENDGFILPGLKIHSKTVAPEYVEDGYLFPMEAVTLQERIVARRKSVDERVAKCVDVVNSHPTEPWVIWCNLNIEAELVTKLIPDAVEIRGSHSPEYKEKSLLGFSDGNIRILVTKPKIAGHGMNWQHCAKEAFLGLSDSWEMWYQAVRRCWRFGQERPVDVYVITADTEGRVVANIRRKESDANKMFEGMLQHTRKINTQQIKGAIRLVDTHKEKTESGKDWKMQMGDSVEVARDIPSDSIHYSIFSPPFASLYTYSNSPRDMGNCTDHSEFQEHFGFLITELFRTTMPGRLVSVHCMNLPTVKVRDGVIGVRDFRGEIIRSFCEAGFVYHSEVCIWKDPVTAMQRTKALGLLYKQLRKDSAMSRMGIPDYVVTFRKNGENPEPVTKTHEGFPVKLWQNYASPIWTDINPSDTLQYRSAREHNDEKHICPLQLQVIRRCVRLWTNPGDTVFSPFAGIGSEGYVALEEGRKFYGIELKESYFQQAVKNLAFAAPTDLFSE